MAAPELESEPAAPPPLWLGDIVTIVGLTIVGLVFVPCAAIGWHWAGRSLVQIDRAQLGPRGRILVGAKWLGAAGTLWWIGSAGYTFVSAIMFAIDSWP